MSNELRVGSSARSKPSLISNGLIFRRNVSRDEITRFIGLRCITARVLFLSLFSVYQDWYSICGANRLQRDDRGDKRERSDCGIREIFWEAMKYLCNFRTVYYNPRLLPVYLCNVDNAVIFRRRIFKVFVSDNGCRVVRIISKPPRNEIFIGEANCNSKSATPRGDILSNVLFRSSLESSQDWQS